MDGKGGKDCKDGDEALGTGTFTAVLCSRAGDGAAAATGAATAAGVCAGTGAIRTSESMRGLLNTVLV